MLDVIWLLSCNQSKPGHLPPEMLHPRCDCTCKFVSANNVRAQIQAECTIGKLNNAFTKKGKAHIFEAIGYTLDDPEVLIAEYERQAKEKYGRGEYIISELKDYGLIINIEIILSGNGKTRYIKSGWQVFPTGRIFCVTIFAGWSRKK